MLINRLGGWGLGGHYFSLHVNQKNIFLLCSPMSNTELWMQPQIKIN